MGTTTKPLSALSLRHRRRARTRAYLVAPVDVAVAIIVARFLLLLLLLLCLLPLRLIRVSLLLFPPESRARSRLGGRLRGSIGLRLCIAAVVAIIVVAWRPQLATPLALWTPRQPSPPVPRNPSALASKPTRLGFQVASELAACSLGVSISIVSTCTLVRLAGLREFDD